MVVARLIAILALAAALASCAFAWKQHQAYVQIRNGQHQLRAGERRHERLIRGVVGVETAQGRTVGLLISSQKQLASLTEAIARGRSTYVPVPVGQRAYSSYLASK